MIWRCPKTLFSWHQKPIFRTLPILKHTHATFVLCIPCCFYQQDDFDAAKKLGKWSWECNTFRKSQYVCLRRPESNGKGKANFTFNYMDFGVVHSLKFHCTWISIDNIIYTQARHSDARTCDSGTPASFTICW